MKTQFFLAAVAALAYGHANAASGKGQPGWCSEDSDCQESSKDYVCVSVQTTRTGVAQVQECLPYKQAGDVCAGVVPGLCPSFSTWDSEFQAISSVCAYIIPEAKCLTASMSSNKKGYVQCMNVTEGDSDEEVGVIYGCVDYDGTNLLFDTDSDSYKLSQKMNYTEVINDGCVNPSNDANSDVVCSGRGTCAPKNAGQMDYNCTCNVGYSGTYCQKIVSNACTTEAQCTAGTCNMETQECECEAGTTGDQCAYCDPNADESDICSGHGKCIVETSAGTVTAAGSGSSSASTEATVGSESSASSSSGGGGTCQCNSGYTGTLCDRKSSTKSSGTDDESSTPSSSSKSGAVSIAAASAAALATSFVAIVMLN